MFNKRIAAALAGTALAASAVIVPQVGAQTWVTTTDGAVGYLKEIQVQQKSGADSPASTHTIFIPEGHSIIPLSASNDPGPTNKCFTHNSNNPEDSTTTTQWNYNANHILGDKVTVDGEGEIHSLKIGDCSTTDGPKKPSETTEPSETTDPTPIPGSSDDEDGSSDAAGSALLGLSALAGSALLSSGGSSAIPDGDGSGPGSADLSSGSSDQDNGNGGDNGAGTGNGGDDAEGPAQGPVDSPDSKATGQQPATGPVGGQDPKAVAQAQAANAPAAAPAKAAPAAQQAAPAPAAQQQLANTGVQGTLIALAAGLAAIAAGALLVLRRRA